MHSAPLLASAEVSNALHGGLLRLVQSFAAVDRQQVMQAQAPDMNVDEYNELLHQLMTLTEQYE